ncbi:right-handed parallel beta-helix repeat-containing protein [Maioricimonas rarisocia]|nr:right-handed parallel beta-helix repeat-containing protein [Maioricimonas rarisocia]
MLRFLTLLVAGITLGLAPAAGHGEVISILDDSSTSGTIQLVARKKGSNKPFGLDGRIGHIGFATVGRDTGLTHIELFPHLRDDDEIFFGDFRAFGTNDGNFGGNVGVGYRFIEPSNTFLLGGSFWYDIDESSTELFHQVGLNLEARTEMFSLDGNLYLPVGNDDQSLSRVINNVRFDQNQLLFDVREKIGEALPGLDINFGAAIPGDFAERHRIEASAGVYYFDGTNVPDVTGVRVMLQGEIVDSLTAETTFTHDDTFGTNATLGIAWRFGSEPLARDGLERSLRRFVNRNYNIIVDNRNVLTEGVVAINPRTGNAYDVQHVSGTAGSTGLGRADSPWDSLEDAMLAGADIIYVHSDSVLNESITLQEGQMLIGEGSAHQIVDATYGTMTLGPGDTSGDMPIIHSPTGDAVVLADNSSIAGFTISAPNGHGIVGDSVTGASVSDVTIDGVGGNGIHLTNIDGTVNFSDVSIRDVTGNGVSIVGGTGFIDFAGDLNIENVGDSGIYISGLETVTETVDDEDVTTTGTVTFENVMIEGNTGATGVHVADSEGHVDFQHLDVETSGGSALYTRNAEQVVIRNGSLSTVNAPAVDSEDSELYVALTSLFADGGAYGVRLMETAGAFYVVGEEEDGSGGSISNTDIAVLADEIGSIGFQRVDFDNNDIGVQVSNADLLELSSVRMTNTDNIVVDAHNVAAMEISDSGFESNDVSSGSNIRFTADEEGSYVARFIGNSVADGRGTIFEATSMAGAEGSSIIYTVANNDIGLVEAGGIGASLDWNGPVQGGLTNNVIGGTANSQTAILLKTADTSDLAQLVVSKNGIVLEGTSSVGVDVDSGAPTLLQVDNNQIHLKGTNGVGLRTVFGRASDARVFQNLISDTAGGGTGILFESIADQSELYIDANVIDLTSSSSYVDRGIILSEVTGDDDPFVRIISTTNNTVSGASTTFFVPNDVVDGELLLNNTRYTWSAP